MQGLKAYELGRHILNRLVFSNKTESHIGCQLDVTSFPTELEILGLKVWASRCGV